MPEKKKEFQYCLKEDNKFEKINNVRIIIYNTHKQIISGLLLPSMKEVTATGMSSHSKKVENVKKKIAGNNCVSGLTDKM